MFRNYFKIAWRNLFRNKGFSITNISGLTIGMTCTIFIMLWVQDELGYDKFHANYGNIFQVMANRDFNNQVFTDPNMVLPLAASLEKDVPQVKRAAVVTHRYPTVFTNGDVMLKKDGYTVSEHFFDMFTWKFIKGNAASALTDPSSIVLTQSTARALFGDADPMGKMLKIDNNSNAKVTAVVADVPGNSTFQFDYIRPFNYSSDDVKRAMANWQSSSWEVYVQTDPGVNIATLEQNINKVEKSHNPNDKVSTYFTFAMNKWRLYSDFKNGKNVGGMIEYVRLFSIIAVIILLIACVNFMNLSTARSEKRAKEVGVRKTLGSDKRQLIIQFFFESMILALIAFIFSIIAVFVLLPAFNTMVDKRLVLDLTQPLFWAGSVLIILITGIVAGSYPALYLSSFNPARVLKGTFLPGKQAVLPRRVLVVTQFVISILLISATIIVYQQIQHIKDRNIGYNPNNLIMISTTDDVQKNYEVIKQELTQTGMVSAVTRTLSPITDIWWRSPGPDYSGKPADANIIFAGENTDVDFTKTMGIKMLQGHDFAGVPSDSGAVLLNKAAVEAMNIKDPVGMQLRYGKNYTVIGVADNVIMGSPFEPVDPMMIFYNPAGTASLSIRLNESAQLSKALPAIENIFKKYNPANPFEYRFADKEFAKKFITEDLISKITNIFAGLAIFICCIGLAGLASFTIEKRIREIGIRKVLGASVQQLLMLISREFLKLVLIAFVIAAPLTWWLMNNWLEKYTFRININVWLLGIVGLLVLLLTLVVVSLNTLRAAVANPVKSLRTE
ncbi:ABC transporter permease [Danxiaibacter flavus]|uniref:ABC transporter permease n=1 Tax=Danxiaibacter flavus TaxID=3049108 RepID=A0ABV3Z9H4_9BACT|nr:ABC transporter permease [Chitinophagaceae bacterium DXS]